jgi:5'-nucleotidase
MATTDRIALVDMDGTIADYDAAMTRIMKTLQDPGEDPYNSRYESLSRGEQPHLEARRILVQKQTGFWKSLSVIQAGMDVVQEIRALGFEMHVLTKGPKKAPNAWGEKLEWCQENIPDAIVTVSGDKSIVYGRVLVDDWPPYFNAWLGSRPRGLVVCVAHPWNESYGRGKENESPNVVRYDRTNLKEVRERLEHAYNRPSGTL